MRRAQSPRLGSPSKTRLRSVISLLEALALNRSLRLSGRCRTGVLGSRPLTSIPCSIDIFHSLHCCVMSWMTRLGAGELPVSEDALEHVARTRGHNHVKRLTQCALGNTRVMYFQWPLLPGRFRIY